MESRRRALREWAERHRVSLGRRGLGVGRSRTPRTSRDSFTSSCRRRAAACWPSAAPRTTATWPTSSGSTSASRKSIINRIAVFSLQSLSPGKSPALGRGGRRYFLLLDDRHVVQSRGQITDAARCLMIHADSGVTPQGIWRLPIILIVVAAITSTRTASVAQEQVLVNVFNPNRGPRDFRNKFLRLAVDTAGRLYIERQGESSADFELHRFNPDGTFELTLVSAGHYRIEGGRCGAGWPPRLHRRRR